MLLTSITTRVPDAPDEARAGEPITVGLPLPPGVARAPEQLAVVTTAGTAVPAQWDVLERWPEDGSIRWVLLDAPLAVPGTFTLQRVEEPAGAEHPQPVTLRRDDRARVVSAGGVSFVVQEGGAALLCVDGTRSIPERQVVLSVTSAAGEPLAVRLTTVTEETVGPLRTTLRLEGSVFDAGTAVLSVAARVSWFAGCASARIEVTLRNPRAAVHAGGYWELGDPGSVLFRDASLLVTGAGSEFATWSVQPGAAPVELATPAMLYQDSSGGASWKSRNHVNRDGTIPLRFRGYELRAARASHEGERATPALWIRTTSGETAVTVRHFWQNFPTALAAGPDTVRIGLFPAQFGDLHELQGGEQKTHVAGVSFAAETIAARPLDWIARPAVATALPEWYARARAVPHLAPLEDAVDPRYEALVHGAIEGADSFENKRETIDEYGWRNFGDIYADHESIGSPAPVVSHYNNQYDAIAGFAAQFFRAGDRRWWCAMDELARHVVDIDIYHTRNDRAAYNGGLFWHTYHYKDAGKATHRCYARVEGVEGGGPSNEHDYTTGLLLYYCLTGAVWAKEAVVELATWVIEMDDGGRTPFRWLTRGDTGLASSTRSTAYHGPGRGAGNSIVTLLNAFRLTQSAAYLEKAEGLIRRCVHPHDDIAARELLDIEERWSYTVFLQALGRYLDDKADLGQRDANYAYARASLLHYATWMAAHEYPYLDKPAALEYPTETWAAQDMRKCDVFLHAARHADTADRARFEERAEFFYRASLDGLGRFETRSRTRPVVLMLSLGFMYAAFRKAGLAAVPPAPATPEFGAPALFIPQKQIAMRRARIVAVIGTAAMLALLGAGAVAFL
jgi:hypothetical protein